jgi:glycosyltransferase involved in cell wall biosynthesis
MTAPARSPSRWIVTQIGSREHYACPLGFHRNGRLARLYTDIWATPTLRSLAGVIKPLEGIRKRHHPELDPRLVKAFNVQGIKYLRAQRDDGRASIERAYRLYDEVGHWFAAKVADHLRKYPLDPASHLLYAFSTGALETVNYARSLGMKCVVNQLDPARTDQILIAEEMQRWPGWMNWPGTVPDSYFDRLRAEWDGADLITVNSDFSKRALISQGADARKIHVVPLAYEPETKPPTRTVGSGQTLEVLWLGQIVLRKGIPYLFEAAKLLEQRGVNVRITIAGPVGISEDAIKTKSANINFLGRVPRAQVLELYSSSDLFVLPTISDGFAITQLEAMSYGLPVIVTPNCGDVVTEGLDGHLIPIRDPAALADRIQHLADNRTLLRQMSDAAREKSRTFTLERYTNTIEQLAREFLTAKSA